MRNYGFDYLIEKTLLLTEMARKSGYWSNNFPEFENLMSSVQSKMKMHEKAPDQSLLPFRKIEYVTKSLFNFLSKEELAAIGINKNKDFKINVRNLAIRDLTPEERIGSRKTREYTPDYAKFAPKNADNSKLQQEFMLIKMVEAYPEKALSEQFAKKLLSDKNIDAYLPDNALKGGSSKFASGMIAKKEKMLKMSMEEAYNIQNKAKSILKKLRNSKRLPKGLATSIYHASSEDIGEQGQALKQDETAPLQAFIDSLDAILNERNEVLKIINTITVKRSQKKPITDEEEIAYEKLTPFEKNVLAEFKMGEIIKIKQLFEQRLENKQPVSIDKINSIIDKLGHEKISKFVRDEFEGLLSDYNEMVYSADADRYATIYDTLTDDLLNNLVDEGIITDEESELLTKWRNISSSLKQSIVSKSSKDANKAAEAQSREDVRNIRQGEYEKRAKEWEAKKQSKKKGVNEPKNDDEDDDMDELSDSEDEEGVMSYMTEQIRKDSHSNIIGEYKDRGFKKAKNYAYWTF